MNLSGDSVLSLADYYGIDNEDIFVVFDDISLDVNRWMQRNSLMNNIKRTKKKKNGLSYGRFQWIY